MKILGIVGTNATNSYNRILLNYMKDHFSAQAEIDLLEIENIPLFNEDDLDSIPQTVKVASQKISDSDAIIIGTPEYNHSIPSALKSLLDWVSCTDHPFQKKPVLIVGASYGTLGTARAQQHLRQIMEAPGIDSVTMPGDEFLLSDCKNAFDLNGKLKDKKTEKFLEQVFNDFITFSSKIINFHQSEGNDASMLVNPANINWDVEYDTVVLGFGGAGATAARFAADSGASVLLVDSAPNGHEGGNTRYSAQLLGTVDDLDKGKEYYKKLTYPMALDPEMIDTYLEGMAGMRQYIANYLDVKPVSIKQGYPGAPEWIKGMTSEYPEYDLDRTHDFTTVHEGFFDAAFWKLLRQKVMDRSDQIDVWFSAPAKHLIQDAATKAIIGVQIERNHVLQNVRAINGVVLTVGGFENDKTAVQDYLGADHLAPLGSIYNKGDGVRMAIEVGAQLWHMSNYESLGMLHGLTVAVPEGERGKLILQWPLTANGSIITVGDDGSRYFNEAGENRHGHIYDHGEWRIPRTNVAPYLVFDQAQFDKFKQEKDIPVDNFFDLLIKASSVADLAKLINVSPEILSQTVTDFNQFAKNGKDYEYGRDPKTMAPLENGPYYALKLSHAVLNTQGGPKRNERAEIVDTNNEPIPHLYGAGELGGICANKYQGGGNLAECLIFGKIAGENAARTKQDETVNKYRVVAEDKKTQKKIVTTTNEVDSYPTSENQYLGTSNDGIGGEVVVRITYVDGSLQNVEVLKQSESGDVGSKAISELPQRMIDANTFDVDVISGASASSKAIKNAVKDALSKATKTAVTQ